MARSRNKPKPKPSPPPKVPSKIAKVVAYIKEPLRLPAWALIIFGIYNFVPEFNSNLQFWLDAAAYLGGVPAMITAVISSPFFGASLIILAIAYLSLVSWGKRRGIEQYLMALGWTVVVTIFVGIYTISLISYVTETVGPRHVFPKQNEKIKEVLSEAQFTATVSLTSVATCFDCDGYALELKGILVDMGWETLGPAAVIGPPPNIILSGGVSIKDVNPKEPSRAAHVLRHALLAAKIPVEIVEGQPRDGNTEIVISPRLSGTSM